MTAVLTVARVPAAPAEGSVPRPAVREAFEHLAGMGVLVWWGVPLTHASGGRDGYALTAALLVLIPALLVLRPLRTASRREVVLALTPALGAGVVCLVSPTHFDGLGRAAKFAFVGLLYLALRSYATSVQRRRLVLVGVMLVGLEQFNQGWIAWWGGDNASQLFQGTFYWHNQAAAFLVGCCAVAMTAAMLAQDRVRWVGRIVAPFCASGVVLTGSRANYALLLATWAGLLVVSCWRRRGRIAAFVLPVATYLLLELVTSRLVLNVPGGPGSVLARRQAGQGVTGSGHARWLFWQAAVHLWERHPLTGAGFGSFGSASVPFMPAGTGLSSLVHNGVLQALSDGGLVLAVPLTAAVLLAWGRALLIAGREVVSRRIPLDWETVAPAAALSPLLIHSFVDFDWSYPSLLAFVAVLAALVPSASRASREEAASSTGRTGDRVVAAVIGLVVVAALLAAAQAARVRYPAMPVPLALRPVVAMADHQPDSLVGTTACRSGLSSSDPGRLRTSLDCTAAAAADAPALQMERAAAFVRLGNPEEGVTLAQRAAAQDPAHWEVRVLLAQVLDEAGRPVDAREVLDQVRQDRVARGRDADVRLVDRALAGLNGSGLQVPATVADASREGQQDGSAG